MVSRTNRRRVLSSLAEMCRGNTSGFSGLMFCTSVAGAADMVLRVVPSHLAPIWQPRSQWPKISSCGRLVPLSRLYVHFLSSMSPYRSPSFCFAINGIQRALRNALLMQTQTFSLISQSKRLRTTGTLSTLSR